MYNTVLQLTKYCKNKKTKAPEISEQWGERSAMLLLFTSQCFDALHSTKKPVTTMLTKPLEMYSFTL